MKTMKADEVVSYLLNKYNKDLSDYLKSDVITIKSPIRFGLDDLIRHEIENLTDGPSEKRLKRLAVVLETTGGYVETVERIHNVFRKHYKHVDFIVPNFAYSAGTVLVLSGDEIYMDYYSVLGPIDPQYETEDGRFVPGLGYLQKFNELVEKINGAKPDQPVRAELAYLLKKFDPAILFLLEQAKNNSVSLLEEWLPRYKFKHWNETETSKKKVTARIKKERAVQIAEILAKPDRWHSHGRGIGIKDLTSEEIKLKINNFEDNPELNKNIRQYYELVLDYCHKLGVKSSEHTVIHTRKGLRRF